MSDYALVSAVEVNAAHRRKLAEQRDAHSLQLEQLRERNTKMLEQERHYARRMLLREARAIVEMVKLGVTISDALDRPDAHGCSNCVWHLKNWRTGQDVDGAHAYVLETNLKNGQYGDPKDVILYALAPR